MDMQEDLQNESGPAPEAASTSQTQAAPGTASPDSPQPFFLYKSGRSREPVADSAVQSYDFRCPAVFSAAQMRKLRLHQEEFLNALAARLSLYLRLEINLHLDRLHTVAFQQFAANLNDPTHLTLFKLDPLRGIGLLEMQPELGLAWVDRLMGGPGTVTNPEHTLTEIEMALLDQVVQVILNEWCQHWRVDQEFRPTLLGHETQGRFLQTSPADAQLLVLSVRAQCHQFEHSLQLVFPFYTLEPLLQHFNQTAHPAPDAPEAAPTPTLQWNSRLDEIKLAVSAAWAELELTARDVLKLQVGHVLELDPHWIERVQVRLAGRPKFTGRLGTRSEKWAVELTPGSDPGFSA